MALFAQVLVLFCYVLIPFKRERLSEHDVRTRRKGHRSGVVLIPFKRERLSELDLELKESVDGKSIMF